MSKSAPPTSKAVGTLDQFANDAQRISVAVVATTGHGPESNFDD